MNKVVRNNNYEVVEDKDKMVDTINLEEILTDYYDNFDYVVGDFAYGKVRLKGFYDSNKKDVKSHNNIKNVQDYLKNCCAYGCKYFILKKIKQEP